MKEKYLTDWEIEMKSLIDEKVEEELKTLIEQEQKTKELYYTDNLVNCELFRNSKKAVYEKEYRDVYTLKVLLDCGFDVASFEKTWMCICERSSILLRCVQDKIDGFYYNENGERIPSNQPMDLNNITITYENGVLKISDNDSSYEFKVDEGQIVYVNGENVLNLTAIPTTDKEKRFIRKLMHNTISNKDNKRDKQYIKEL